MNCWAADGSPAQKDDAAMTLTVNGNTTDYDGEATLAALLAHLGADPERVATMLNDDVVQRADRAATPLADHDRVEILSFAGGG
jgi:sulfur carrier protein